MRSARGGALCEASGPDTACSTRRIDRDLKNQRGRPESVRRACGGQCLALDARGGNYRNGTPVIQRECNADLQSSYWRVRTVGDRVRCDGDTCTSNSAAYPTLQNRYTGKCLDARNSRGGRPPARAVLQQWSCIGTADDWNAGNQLFSVRNVR